MPVGIMVVERNDTMSQVTAFRLLLVASWLVPLALALIDLALYMATPHATAIGPGPPVTPMRLVLEQVAIWLGWVALLTGLLATVGLWWFKHWAIYVFVVGVAAYVGYVGLCDEIVQRWEEARVAYVQSIEKASDAAAIVHAVVSLGRGLGMKVTAEGVETPDQHLFLRAAGVHFMQGYRFGKPMAADAITARIAVPGVYRSIEGDAAAALAS